MRGMFRLDFSDDDDDDGDDNDDDDAGAVLNFTTGEACCLNPGSKRLCG